jgi:hypothetical protein
MAIRLGSPAHSLRFLQVLTACWQAIVFAFITMLLPKPTFIAGIILSVTGICLAIAGVLRGHSLWTKFSILETWLLFFTLLVSQALSNTIVPYLPITLLQSIMILFAHEVSTVCCEFQQQFSSLVNLENNLRAFEGRLYRSSVTAFRTVSRAGVLFASCYVLSIALLYLSTFTAFAPSLTTDISLYIVVVSIALALLLVSREDER